MSKSIHGTNSIAPPPSLGARRAVAELGDLEPIVPEACERCGAALGGAVTRVCYEAPAGALLCCPDCPGCLCG